MGAARKYPDELRDRAIRLVLDVVKDQETSVTAACRKVGCGAGNQRGHAARLGQAGAGRPGHAAGEHLGGCGADAGAGAGER